MNRFFQDKNGRVVLWQWPSPLLWGWLIVRMLAHILSNGTLGEWCGHLGTALLGAWAVMELATGVNYFRRCLGLGVLLVIIWQFLQ